MRSLVARRLVRALMAVALLSSLGFASVATTVDASAGAIVGDKLKERSTADFVFV
jgi:hypothetical protein